MRGDGLYFLDEPESALSFKGQLQLLRIMHEAVKEGAQFIVSTHSPLLMSYPQAAIYELSEDGVRRVDFDEIEAVGFWRGFLEAPERTFRYLFEP